MIQKIARLVREPDCGVWWPPEEPLALARAIQSFSKQPELLERLGNNGCKYVCEHYDRKALTGRYHELLHQVASKRK